MGRHPRWPPLAISRWLLNGKEARKRTISGRTKENKNDETNEKRRKKKKRKKKSGVPKGRILSYLSLHMTKRLFSLPSAVKQSNAADLRRPQNEPKPYCGTSPLVVYHQYSGKNISTLAKTSVHYYTTSIYWYPSVCSSSICSVWSLIGCLAAGGGQAAAGCEGALVDVYPFVACDDVHTDAIWEFVVRPRGGLRVEELELYRAREGVACAKRARERERANNKKKEKKKRDGK